MHDGPATGQRPFARIERADPASTPPDVSLGEVYRLAARTADDVAYMRGRIEAVTGIDHRVIALEQWRKAFTRSVVAFVVAAVPVLAAAVGIASA